MGREVQNESKSKVERNHAGGDGGWSLILGGAIAAFAFLLAVAASTISPPAQAELPAVIAGRG